MQELLFEGENKIVLLCSITYQMSLMEAGKPPQCAQKTFGISSRLSRTSLGSLIGLNCVSMPPTIGWRMCVNKSGTSREHSMKG